jgi:flagellin-like protein
LKRPEKLRPVFPVKNPLRKLSDERGVSPVIAVILMVAITVVLAAVLYVMVMGLLDQPQESIKISMRWDESGTDPGTYTGNVIAITGKAPNIDDVTLVIGDGEAFGSKKLDALKAEGNFTVGSITANYYDLNGDNILGANDIFSLKGVSQGDSVKLTYKETSEMTKIEF